MKESVVVVEGCGVHTERQLEEEEEEDDYYNGRPLQNSRAQLFLAGTRNCTFTLQPSITSVAPSCPICLLVCEDATHTAKTHLCSRSSSTGAGSHDHDHSWRLVTGFFLILLTNHGGLYA